MTTIEMTVLGLGILAVIVIYGLVFYDMYKFFRDEDMIQAEAESTLGLVEDDEE